MPSLTHALFRLGAGRAVVGRTDYCVRPADSVDRVEAVADGQLSAWREIENGRELVRSALPVLLTVSSAANAWSSPRTSTTWSAPSTTPSTGRPRPNR